VTADTQDLITDWFNAVYRRKGDRYLRPAKAYFIFLELLGAAPSLRLLDVACGLGRLLEAARDYGVSMHGIDLSSVAVDMARRNVPKAEIIEGNAEHLPYPDGAFDLVTCIASLERVLDRRKALAEIHRVGTQSARYCILVRNAGSARWQLRRFLRSRKDAGNAGAESLQDWTRLLESAGFRVVSVWPDQYPLMRRRRWLSLGLWRVDYRKPLRGKLERSNEFLFMLEKRH
jgi:SAM-dependent methyltransferase